MRFVWWIIVTAVTILAIVAFAYAVTGEQRWEGRCHALGGRVESRFVDFVPSGKVLVPIYSYHCWVSGREVKA
jgi:hypothetical protein